MSELSSIATNRDSGSEIQLKPDGRMLTLLPGQRLRAARERLKLTQHEIAEQLKLPKRMVIAIELDDYASLPNRTFAKGYLRSYARLVKISPDEISAAYDQVTNRADERASLVVANLKSEPLYEGAAFSIINSIIVGILVIGIIVAAMWAGERWLNARHQDSVVVAPVVESTTTEVEPRSLASDMMAANSAPHNEVGKNTNETNPLQDDQADEEELPPPAVDVNMQPLVPSVESRAPSVESRSALVESRVPSVIPPNSVTEAASSAVLSQPLVSNAVTPASTSGLTSINMRFPGFCWVQIKDADGAILEEGTKSSGAVLNVQGKAPFAVRLGNPPAATLSFNGQTVDLSSYPAKKQIRLLCADNQCQQISR